MKTNPCDLFLGGEDSCKVAHKARHRMEERDKGKASRDKIEETDPTAPGSVVAIECFNGFLKLRFARELIIHYYSVYH